MTQPESPLILITGATGYIGGRLVPRLLQAGFRVRCLVRDASRLQGRAWRDGVELIEGDVLRPDSLTAAIRVGEALDFWRVEAIEPGRLLRLRAEMKLPGKAWLQFEASVQEGDARPLLTQTAFFAPKGLSGLAYWYFLYPIHGMIFGGMIRRLAWRAKTLDAGNPAAV